MLASAPRLNSADRPMKTSVLRQRKGSGRKQHLLSWAWQQGRGQVVEILQSEKQTERFVTKKLKMGGGERYNIPAPQSRNVSKNQQQLNRQKTKDQNSQMKIVHKKKERGHTYTSSAAARQAMQNGGKNKNFPNNQNWNSSLSSSSLLFKSQTNQNYAGAKFSEPPSPSVLPKPPSHWVPVSFNPSDKEIMTFQLKTLLKVQV
ncbi:proline-rich nuclear receptor coactivator 2 [Prionailurus iriomotensis]